MRNLLQAVAVVVLFLLVSMQAAAYEPGDAVLFALEGAFIQETVYTHTITATPETFPSDVAVTMSVPASKTWQYRRSQEISNLSQAWNPDPETTSQQTDNMGNVWSTATWSAVSDDVESITQVRCREETTFEPILTWSNGFPLDAAHLPRDVLQWLKPDSQMFIQSDAPQIRQLAQELSSGSALQIEAVGRILAWVQENVRVAQCDELVDKVDALWVLENRMGRCSSFANLAVALLRAAGIPAIPVSGVVADSENPSTGHAWIAVYFTDLAWFEFESSSWMPQSGEVPETILTPQHITLDTAGEQGVSSTPFVEHHACSIDVKENPRELQFVDTAIEPGDAVTWVITLRSPSYYEIYEWEYGYRDLPVSLSLDGIPPGWCVSLSATDVLLRKQDVGAAPSRSLLLTILPSEDAAIGTQGVITVTARDTGKPGQPVVGVLTAAVTIKAP
ncbi:transglutaminase domain-containing protein [Candidatus Bipolaricaulota bacterium]